MRVGAGWGGRPPRAAKGIGGEGLRPLHVLWGYAWLWENRGGGRAWFGFFLAWSDG